LLSSFLTLAVLVELLVGSFAFSLFSSAAVASTTGSVA